MDKIYSLIGLAYRANKVSYGVKAMEKIAKKKCYLVVLADDASEKTKKKVFDKCATYQIPVKSNVSRERLSKCIGKEDIVMVSINEEGFAKSIFIA